MSSDFFKDTLRWNIERNGTERALPYFYYDSMSLSAVYTASTVKVRQLIPHPDLHPVELQPGRCLVSFSAFEYRKIDDEPYNEFSIAFLISYPNRSLPIIATLKAFTSPVIPVYVWQLPVTTESARAGGVDLFIFPKILAEIKFSKTKDMITCTLKESDKEILNMTGRILPSQGSRSLRYLSYTYKDGVLLSVNTLVNAIEFARSMRSKDVNLEIASDHPIGLTLKEIELGTKPIVYQFSPLNQSILFPGRNARDV